MTMRLLLCCAVVAGDAKRRRLVGRRRRRECLAAAPQVPARRVVAADLVREAREALRLPYHDPSRYFSVEQDPARGGAVDVYALAGSWPHSNKRDTTTRRRCADAGLGATCGAAAVVLRAPFASMNLALLRDAHGALAGALGGKLAGLRTTPALRSPLAATQRFDAAFRPAGDGFGGAFARDKCVERRAGFDACEFDGRFSAAALRGRTLVYARANTRAGGGGRAVQVVAAAGAPPPPGAAWGPFRRVRFLAGAEAWQRAVAADVGADVYTFAAKPNPVDPGGSLAALFPVAVAPPPDALNRTARYLATEAYVALAFSCDGVRFSAPVALLRATPASDRGEVNDHPVDGFATLADGRPAFYVHEGVPGTFKELCAYRADKSAGVASRLVRYALDRAALEAATRDAKRALACAAS